MASGERKYGGRSQMDRVAERREKLLRAAVGLYGRVGREGASVSAICAEAGLTTRYFYESFPSHDALFLAVFRGMASHLVGDLRTACEADGDPLTAFFAALADHVGLARLFLADLTQQEPAVQTAGRQLGTEIAALIAPAARDDLAVAGVLGAIFGIARLWVEGECVEPVEDVAATARRFVRAAD